MSRTIKDSPGYLKSIKKNEDELSRAYLREKNPRYRKVIDCDEADLCLDCDSFGNNGNGTCPECADDSIEDLVTRYEKLSAA